MQVADPLVSEQQLLSRGLPTELTVEGIRQLFSPGNNQEFVLQIIKILEDCTQSRLCHLSDGFCYITCVLSGEAKLKNIKGQMEVFDVIRIHKEDVIVLGLDRNPSIELCNFNILGMRLLCAIGEPVAYQTYFNNGFANSKGSSKIADGQKLQSYLTIPELTENYPQVPTKWILKAKIVKKPDNINPERPFMIIKLLDDKQNTIQGVFFGQSAVDASKKLAYGREYLFNNGQIKLKKNSEEFEIKFTEQSQFIPIETMRTGPQQIQNVVSINNITNNANLENKLITITGKVFKLKNLNKGRCLDIMDQNDDVIEVVLWEEIKDEVKEGVTYIFENLRKKNFNNLISLQSDKYKTKVKRAPYQIEKVAQNNTKKFNYNGQNSRKFDPKSANSLLNISQIVQLKTSEKQFKDVTGFLIISTTYMDTKNFFQVDCPGCNSKEISVNPLSCRKCSCETPTVRWNIRCHIMDEKQNIKCAMNEELCQKVLKMSSVEGYRKLLEDADGFQKLIAGISHLEGIFKIKVNPYKDSVFYNIVEMYQNDSLAILQKVTRELKMAFKKSLAG